MRIIAPTAAPAGRRTRAAVMVAVAAALLAATACGGGGGLPGMPGGPADDATHGGAGGGGGRDTGADDIPADGEGGEPGGDDRRENGEDGGRPDGGGAGFRVTQVILTVHPGTLAGVRCQTAVPQNYTAVFTFPEGHKGGEITFRYGPTSSSMKMETMRIPAGKESATKFFFHSEFIFSGSLAAAQVNVTAPNAVGSATVAPTGTCSGGSTYGSTSGDTGSW